MSVIDIFLEKNRSVSSNNVKNDLNISLDNKNRLLPDENLSDEFSLYEQYNKERDECDKYRIILNINPVCSNVLFNMKTEIIRDEGSEEPVCLNYDGFWTKAATAKNAINGLANIHYEDAIKNTEYSHPNINGSKDSGYVYYCGLDIFNNHMLRKRNFIHVNKLNYNSIPEYYNQFSNAFQKYSEVYNTIEDYIRYSNGDVVKMKLPSSSTNDSSLVDMHLYTTDNIYTLKDAYYERCKEKDGWWGFVNPGTINIENNDLNLEGNAKYTDHTHVNQMLTNKKPCEFIDMYPDRSLFSFIPKYNKKRKRLERNWDYCITYPYKKDVILINKICGGEDGAIKVNLKVVTNSSGIRLVQCSSYFKHTLRSGSYVNFYYYGDTENDEDTFFQKYQSSIRVYSVGDLNGDYDDRVFSVKYDDVKKIYDSLVNGCFYKKVSNGSECFYYARKFKKIKLLSDLNKAGFSKNIYGDDNAQIVFTDGVEGMGLIDENGRETSEVYFTVIKRNKGYRKWYHQDSNVGEGEIIIGPSDRSVVDGTVENENDIEFSHCFGKVTSGIDFSGVDIDEEPFDYNIHYLHNVKGDTNNDICIQNTINSWGETLKKVPRPIEDGISFDDDYAFYGDIVEFDSYLYERTVIAEINHRFNTYQRELFDLHFRDLYQDVVSYDDYENSLETPDSFKVETYYLNDYQNTLHRKGDAGDGNINNLIYANIMPEGYFYKPHYQIKIKEDSEVYHSEAKYINYDKLRLKPQNVIIHEWTLLNGETIQKKEFLSEFETVNTRAADTSGDPDTSVDENYYTEAITESVDGYYLTVRVPVDYGFLKEDFVAVYDKTTREITWAKIVNYENYNLTIYLNADDYKNPNGSFIEMNDLKTYFSPLNGERRYFIFWSNDSVPTYAKLCYETNTFSWRTFIKPSEMNRDSELYDMPFANGYFYLHKNFNIFLKRQDPRGLYGLSNPIHKESVVGIMNPMLRYIINGSTPIDLSKFRYLFNKGTNNCY